MNKIWIGLIGCALILGLAGAGSVEAGDGLRKTYLPVALYQSGGVYAGPLPGYYASSNNVDAFYVLPDRAWVQNFSTILTIGGCGTYKLTRVTKEAITNAQFAFTGAFYASGAFTPTHTATGKVGLASYHIPDCGTITGGPWTWTATWKNSNQPALAEVIWRDANTVIEKLSEPRP